MSVEKIRAIDLCCGAGGWGAAGRGLPIERLGVSVQRVSAIESGRDPVGDDWLRRAAEALGVLPEQLGVRDRRVLELELARELDSSEGAVFQTTGPKSREVLRSLGYGPGYLDPSGWPWLELVRACRRERVPITIRLDLPISEYPSFRSGPAFTPLARARLPPERSGPSPLSAHTPPTPPASAARFPRTPPAR